MKRTGQSELCEGEAVEEESSLMTKTVSPTLTCPPASSMPRLMPKNGEFPYSFCSRGSKEALLEK